jgi:hypothetical protein
VKVLGALTPESDWVKIYFPVANLLPEKAVTKQDLANTPTIPFSQNEGCYTHHNG